MLVHSFYCHSAAELPTSVAQTHSCAQVYFLLTATQAPMLKLSIVWVRLAFSTVTLTEFWSVKLEFASLVFVP